MINLEFLKSSETDDFNNIFSKFWLNNVMEGYNPRGRDLRAILEWTWKQPMTESCSDVSLTHRWNRKTSCTRHRHHVTKGIMGHLPFSMVETVCQLIKGDVGRYSLL
ncbi:hypothetical protein PoB_001604000 [Plakobranchus ocellatus]|uniref:Uncharacterized protein n=1 Tax=Plakobranchus ocellatus TaxID=259542 RepID=A0AAV3Z2Y8_9GAST|nr:hypothetical protein PoB_001604000 [Plakobranchus ocellatus]